MKGAIQIKLYYYHYYIFLTSDVRYVLCVLRLLSRMNLGLVKELGDRAAQGRAFGNLGNTHYLLGNFVEAIKFHRQVRRVLPAQCSSTRYSKGMRRPELIN